MSTIRTLLAVLALFGLTLSAARAQLCDDRYPLTCQPQAPAEAAEVKDPPKPAAQTKRSVRSSSKRTASSHGGRRSKSVPAQSAAAKPVAERPKAANKGADAPAPETTAAGSVEVAPTPPERPRRPVDAVPVASQDEVNEIDLSADRLLVSPIPLAPTNTQLTPPLAAPMNSAQPPVLSGPAISPRPAISVQTTTILRPSAASDPSIRPPVANPAAAGLPAANSPPATEITVDSSVASSSRSNADSEDMSWLRRIFLGLGGVLAVASAIRMFIG